MDKTEILGSARKPTENELRNVPKGDMVVEVSTDPSDGTPKYPFEYAPPIKIVSQVKGEVVFESRIKYPGVTIHYIGRRSEYAPLEIADMALVEEEGKVGLVISDSSDVKEIKLPEDEARGLVGHLNQLNQMIQESSGSNPEVTSLAVKLKEALFQGNPTIGRVYTELLSGHSAQNVWMNLGGDNQ